MDLPRNDNVQPEQNKKQKKRLIGKGASGGPEQKKEHRGMYRQAKPKKRLRSDF